MGDGDGSWHHLPRRPLAESWVHSLWFIGRLYLTLSNIACCAGEPGYLLYFRFSFVAVLLGLQNSFRSKQNGTGDVKSDMAYVVLFCMTKQGCYSLQS